MSGSIHRGRKYLLLGIGIMGIGSIGMIFIILFAHFDWILVFFTALYLGYTIANVITSSIVLDQDRHRNYEIMGDLQFFSQFGSITTSGLYLLIIGANITSNNWFIFPVIITGLSMLYFSSRHWVSRKN